jgi:phosphinothricin acetyltransferase
MANIRLANPSRDARQIAAIYYPYVVNTHITFESIPPDGSEITCRMKSQEENYPWIVCEHDSELMGFAYGNRFRSRKAYNWSVETTIYVREAAHELGIGSALYTTLLECLKLQGYVSAVGVIALPNKPSTALHEKFGFRQNGILPNIGYKSGNWYDVGMWWLELQSPPSKPEEIIPTVDVKDTQEFNDALRLGDSRIKI